MNRHPIITVHPEIKNKYQAVRYGVVFVAQTESGLRASMSRYYDKPKHKRRGIGLVTPMVSFSKKYIKELSAAVEAKFPD